MELEKVEDIIFTYIGSGDEPPRTCNFMGQQPFTMDEPVTIDGTKTFLIGKLRGNPSFVEGKVTKEQKQERDEEVIEAKKKAEKNREKANLIAAAELRKRNKV